MNLLRCIGLVIILLYCAASISAQNIGFQNFNIQAGLAQSQVTCLFQDQKGYLWIGTYGGGVSRYDGFSFTNYTEADGLVNNLVSTIVGDSRGRVWIGTSKGVSIFENEEFSTQLIDRSRFNTDITKIIEINNNTLLLGTCNGIIQYQSGKFTPFSIPEDFNIGKINDLLLSDQGQLWIATDGNGVFMIERDQVAQIQMNNGLPSNYVNALDEDQEDNIWVGTEEGVAVFKKGHLSQVRTIPELTNSPIHDILMDSDGNIWFATSEGVSVYNGKTMMNFSEKQGLSSNIVWSLLMDRENNIWIGTYRGGIDKVIRKYFTTFTSREGLCGNVIRCILLDQKKQLWFATDRGGVALYDGTKFRCFDKSNGLINDFVLCLYQDKKGVIWVGTVDGINFFDGHTFHEIPVQQSLKGKMIRSVTEDRDGNIWIGTNDHGIYIWDYNTLKQITTSNGLNSDEVMQVNCTSDGKIWIATLNGINYFDGINLIDFTRKYDLPQDQLIYSVLEGSDKTLWFATYGSGLILADPVSNDDTNDYNIVEFTTRDGLHTNYLVSLVFDRDKNLWIGTEKGLNKFDYPLYRKQGMISFQYFGKYEGFDESECIHNAASLDQEGNVWIGTLMGAVRYKPTQEINTISTFESQIYITKILMYLQDIDWSLYSDSLSRITGLPVGVKFPPGENHLRIYFTGIYLTNPEKVCYKYMLEGLDEDYGKSTQENFASYSNLDAGSYLFKVISCNDQGIWNMEPATFSFTIKPLFWQTKIFYILTGIILIITIWLLVKLRTKRILHANRLLESRVEQRTMDLQSALEKSEESDRLKSTFLATMSHELRTPLNAVLGFSQLIDETTSRDEITTYVKTIYKNGYHLLEIIEDIFEISLIDSGEVKLNNEEFSLITWIRNIHELILQERHRMDKQNVNISCLNIHDSDELLVFTDPGKLQQILLNLLKNALKFTTGGSIKYGYQMAYDDDKPVVKFFVKDTGIGIKPELKEIIFESFRQGDDSHTRLYGGTGLGLSVSHKLTQLLGGIIWFDTQPGKGSQFYFTIPKLQAEPGQGKSVDHEAEASPGNRFSGRKILIAEDEVSSYEFLKVLMKKWGIQTIWAKDGREAVNLCSSDPEIDLVLMDIKMPVMSGYEAAKQIKQIRPDLPIIAQTALAIKGEEEKTRQSGCDDYISKPINKQILYKMILQFFQ